MPRYQQGGAFFHWDAIRRWLRLRESKPPRSGGLTSPTDRSAPVTPEAVVWAYRLILGREPESEAVINQHLRHPDVQTLRRVMFGSDEFNFIRVNELGEGGQLAWLRDRWVAVPVLAAQYLMWINLGDTYMSLGCLFDNYEPAQTYFVRSALATGDVFVDVGANAGWYTLVASSVVGETGRVLAFEPRADTADYLEKTVLLNGLASHVTVSRYALSDAESSGLLSWPAGTSNSGGSYLSPTAPIAGHESQPVLLRTLDSLKLMRLDFLKIDVEGAEMRVVNGARETLARCRPIIMSELTPEALAYVSGVSTQVYFAFFEQLGYRCHIAEDERWGDEISEFPADWPRPLINLGLVPREKAFAPKSARFPQARTA
jgi:FkbM family methyltransferase